VAELRIFDVFGQEALFRLNEVTKPAADRLSAATRHHPWSRKTERGRRRNAAGVLLPPRAHVLLPNPADWDKNWTEREATELAAAVRHAVQFPVWCSARPRSKHGHSLNIRITGGAVSCPPPQPTHHRPAPPPPPKLLQAGGGCISPRLVAGRLAGRVCGRVRSVYTGLHVSSL
jgi:hypothetical protein